jgi:predicted transposase/invertase (TIGR01784 family)
LKNCKNKTTKIKVKKYDIFEDIRETAFRDGKIKAQKRIAKNMLTFGLTMELIVETTGLSEAEIEKL